MENKNLERTVDNALFEIKDVITILKENIESLENDLLELEKQHEQSLKVAFKKGYTTHANLVNTLNK
tara:strand:+ start:407 stop:607 length:201 start_codon:yes stop_codon:yes gene_type:complete